MRTSHFQSNFQQPRKALGGTSTVSAFTLLEIMLAVMVLVIITVVVYDFTDTTLSSARMSVDMADQDTAFSGMRRLIETQLASIPISEAGAFVGVNIRSKNTARRDMLQMVCPAGNALLSPDAKGFYQITLGVRENPRGSGKYSLGMNREPWTSDEDDDDDDEDANGNPINRTTSNRAPKTNLPADWIPLMEGITGLEVAYFDVRLNGWVDKWTDSTALPNLVRMRLLAVENQPPYEIIARVPNGGPHRTAGAPGFVPPMPPNLTPPSVPPGGFQVPPPPPGGLNPPVLPPGGLNPPAFPGGGSRRINPGN